MQRLIFTFLTLAILALVGNTATNANSSQDQAIPDLLTSASSYTGVNRSTLAVDSGVGMVSGTVYASGSFTPLDRIHVRIFSYDHTFVYETCTNSQGAYSLWIPSYVSAYVIAYGSGICGRLGYGYEYWREASSVSSSTPIQITAANPAFTNINFTLDSTTAPPPPPVRLVALEAVQTIQDWRNSIPMIQDKKTMVRAHVEPSSSSVSVVNVQLVLRGERNGVALPGSPMVPEQGANFQAYHGVASQRAQLNGSPYFWLPTTWLNGTVKLTIERVDNGQLDCGYATVAESNKCSMTVAFQPSGPIDIRLIPLHTGINPTTSEDIQAMQDVLQRTLALLPIAKSNLSVSIGQPLLRLQPFGSEPEFRLTNALLAFQRILDGCPDPCRRLYFGVSLGTPPSGIIGFANDSYQSANSFVLSEPSRWRNAAVHELGHLLGRSHVSEPSCSSPDADPGFPNNWELGDQDHTIYPTIGPVTQELSAWIYGLDTSFSPPHIIDPRQHFELMSYCAPTNNNYQWISDYTYNHILANLKQNSLPPTFAVAAGGSVMSNISGTQDYLIIRGAVDTQANTASFDPFAFVSSSTTFPLPSPGDYKFQLLNITNNVLSEVPFKPDTGENGGTIGMFLTGIPANPAITKAQIVHNGVVIGSITASNNAPTVTITSPNGGETLDSSPFTIQWTSSDPDSGTLTSLIQYSWNNGINWETVAVDLTGNSYTVDSTTLHGSANGLFRIQVSDGFNTATDQSDAVFSIAKKSPEITVQSPGDNTVVQTGTSLRLLASAQDQEDGEIPSTNFTWTSDLDGALGTGNDLTLNLSAGMHTITVTAQDSDGNISSKSITVFETNLLNDDFEHGSEVTVVPYSRTEDTSEATIAADDAMPGCGTNVGATVWYHFTAPATAVYQFDTLGSDYDTVLVMSSGPRAAQVAEGCSDDAGVPQSKLELTLTSGTEYHIMLGGNNGATGHLIFTVSSPMPILLAPDNYTSTGNRQPIFSWNPANQAVSYEIQIDHNYPPSKPAISTIAANYMPPYPLLTTTYYWRVRAIRGNSTVSDWTDIRTITIASPANAAPQKNLINTATPTLTWGRLSWANGYHIQVDNDSNFGSPEVDNNTLSGSTFEITISLPTNRTYYWRIQAKKPDGTWGGWSATESFVLEGE